MPHEGVWAFPGVSENLPTASKDKSELVRLVRPPYRRVRVLQEGMSWMAKNHKQSKMSCPCQ